MPRSSPDRGFFMRTLTALLLVAAATCAGDPQLLVKPDAFATLVNPNCSHCLDEAKRRKDELKETDPVLMWTRGKYDGGAVPIRFFLNPYRVISDTYGVFVYDPDAGFARGFTASVDFRFHGWRNGVMVMRHKDGTQYSCLTGLAFDGPRKGDRLAPWPTVTTNWGWVMRHYPGGVAYHMFEKYQPVELPTKENADSVRTRPDPDPRLPPETPILGVYPGGRAKPRAFRLRFGDVKAEVVGDVFVDGRKVVVLYQADGDLVSAYEPIADRHEAVKGLSVEGKVIESKAVKLRAEGNGFVDAGTGSRFDAVGRCVDGELRGWTLRPYDAVRVKWFAWAAEHPDSTIAGAPVPLKADPKAAIKEVAGTAEFLRAVPKKWATVQAVDAKAGTVTLIIEGEKEPRAWPLTPDAEVKIAGWWGRLEQLTKGARVWVWFHTDRKKVATSIFMLADEASAAMIHEDKAADAARRDAQRAWLRGRWVADGLPGTVEFVHIAGEADVMLDHEAMRWGRSLKAGDKVSLAADPPIPAVVKDLRPWRERTQVRVVINGVDIAELKAGQRTHLKMTPPEKEIEESDYPPDMGRKRTRGERIEWFLASTYCTCKIGGDVCTGDFYTLASCNPNGCGNPNMTRKRIGELIDKGLDDKQIFDDLRAERGPLLTKPHLRP
jgi:hypothetical protein